MFWVCFMVCMCLFCVFFFKQKTAYEMRISDWSSDVCSSDLLAYGSYLFDHFPPPSKNLSLLRRTESTNFHDSSRLTITAVQHFCRRQIGRASCRERVCQYV